MFGRELFPVALSVFLAACGGEIADDQCELYQAPDPATSPFAAKVDGRQFATGAELSQVTGVYHPDFDELEFYGTVFHQGYWQELVFIAVPAVSGPGAYPIGPRTPGLTSQGYYYCERSNKGDLNSIGAAGDSVWITSIDTLTGAIAGSFTFHALGGRDGEQHVITDGKFHLQTAIHHHPAAGAGDLVVPR